MSIFKLPDLGEGLPDAEVHEWHVKEGDTVKVDQLLVSMETAKAVVEVPSPQAGKILKLHGQPGDIIKTGSPLVEFESDQKAPAKSADTGTVVGNIESSGETLQETFTIGAAKTATTGAIKATPAVRALARKLNVDLGKIQGSGPNGIITKHDLEQANKGFDGIGELKALKGARRTMATMMAKSQAEVVPVTIYDDADIDAWSKDSDITVRLIQAVIAACKKEPSLNAWYDSQAVGLRIIDDINLGVAMDTGEDLFVPVIKASQTKSATELRSEINRLKQGVRNRDLAPDELRGASITLSNFGNFAGRYANPIIVPPTVAILGVGRLRDDVVASAGQAVVHRVIPISLTFDHRGITGGEATRFLGTVIEALEQADA